MQITQASDYAMRAVMHLARKEKGTIVDAKVIAEEENIPLRFLLKIFRSLIQAEIVKSYRGVNGGYVLNRELKDISMLSIIEAMEGPIRINKCMTGPGQCNLHEKTSDCCFHRAWSEVQKDTVQKLREYDFETLINSQNKEKNS